MTRRHREERGILTADDSDETDKINTHLKQVSFQNRRVNMLVFFGRQNRFTPCLCASVVLIDFVLIIRALLKTRFFEEGIS